MSCSSLDLNPPDLVDRIAGVRAKWRPPKLDPMSSIILGKMIKYRTFDTPQRNVRDIFAT